MIAAWAVSLVPVAVVTLDGRLGEVGGISSESPLVKTSVFSLEADETMLRLLVGRPKGLEGRSSELLIWLGRRTNGLAFSGDNEPFFVGERPEDGLLGEETGVVARTVAGEVLF